ncbi:MAG: undecaprenyldiphospho-muramoylpentapeptide beta-N-acetylglucosaminyltransferase [Gammaproteobacteria bacterium]|uniref:UDP-N-acetylglucosamine--N-acetylmuramyl-(pentapeptide) pyrophosphoryl-undecaprenol N-acetylglucosamine transferase n=1 Tax=Candidatus Thiopontia autotrophica TaxID=2841688 RepID=A0A8J6P548_9GAMM|nr:undecaprenyldiphospho-muramoylpentapeptide beta-N-acetylglucosaminyltransferase [Candidatus Thiopontia autotrophica]
MTAHKKKCLMIMAGGTGGHIYPALAVAELWRRGGDEVIWLGTRTGMESRLVPEAGIGVEWISIHGLRGKGIISLLLAPFHLSRAIAQSIGAIWRIKPDVVLGMGGFVAGPGGVAAWIMRRPLVIHEQNAVAGLTNRLLSTVSRRVLEAFPGTFGPGKKVVQTGNPLRSRLMDMEIASSHNPLRLLVLGGSLGAQRINQLIPEMISMLLPEERLEIYHQTGESNLKDTELEYIKHGVVFDSGENSRVVAYIENMQEAYQWSDLVLCRAGAMTVSELAMVGRPAILVPFPFAVDDHQTANGNFLQSDDAALLVQQRDLDGERLLGMIREFIQHPGMISEMGEKARELSRPEAAADVVSICKELC